MDPRQGFVDEEAEFNVGEEGEVIEPEVDAEIDAEAADLPPEPEPEADGRDWEAEAKEHGWYAEGGNRTAREFVEYREARRQGWDPNKGNKTPREYLETGERIDRNRSDKLQRQQDEFDARIARMERMQEQARIRDRERIEASYNAKIRETVEIGDVNSFDQLNTARDEALKDYEAPQAAPQPAKEFAAWQAENTWFNSPNQRGATQYALAEFQDLIEANPHMAQAALLPQLNAKMAETFPDLVGAKRRQAPRQMADRGGARRSRPGNAKGVAGLPPEARKAGKEYVEDGLFPNMEAYAKEYWAQ